MKKIYILLTKSETILSKIVHIITGDTYTHVAISFEEDLQPLYSSSRKNGETLFPAGPCKEHFHIGPYKKNPFIPCALYELEVEDEAYELAKAETELIMSKADIYGFNIIGLILCHLKIPFPRKNHFFCSQLVSEILQRSKAVELPKETTLMKPSDYTRMPGLACRFKGRLCDLLRIKSLIAMR